MELPVILRVSSGCSILEVWSVVFRSDINGHVLTPDAVLIMSSSNGLPGVLEKTQSRVRIRLGPHWLGGRGGEVLPVSVVNLLPFRYSDCRTVQSEMTKLLPHIFPFSVLSLYLNYLTCCSLASQVSNQTMMISLPSQQLCVWLLFDYSCLFFSLCQPAGMYLKSGLLHWKPAPRESVSSQFMTHW